MTKLAFYISLCLCFVQGAAHGTSDSLYIKKQAAVTGFSSTWFCSFLADGTFSTQNATLALSTNDTLFLTVINLDDQEHTFTIDGVIESNNTIPALAEVVLTILPLPAGTYRFYSTYAYGELLGASGILSVGYSNYALFYWNLFEIDIQTSDSIGAGWQNSIPPWHRPTYFTLNGTSYPSTLSDPTAAVTGSVGDTLIVSVVNSGTRVHSLHFHGYHAQILNARVDQFQVGWFKDSVPIKPGEALTFRVVPHQPGVYPVHAHELVSTTTGGIYPGGMITTISIVP